MGELCPGAVLEPAAVPPPLDLFPWSPPIEPGAHRPAHPNSQTTKTCRGQAVGCAPARRAGAGGRAPAEILWSSNPPPSPRRSPCPRPPHPGQACGLLARQRLAGHFLDRAAAGGGELCPPPPARPGAGRINCAAGRN